MMVPRAFVYTQGPTEKPLSLSKKSPWRSQITKEEAQTWRRPSAAPQGPPTATRTTSAPVHIPTKKSKSTTATPSDPPTSAVSSVKGDEIPSRKPTPQEMLKATAIPIRRRPKGRPIQKLPLGDHVADFSKLMLQDVPNMGDGPYSASVGNPQFEALFGNIDELVEGQMFIGSEGIDANILSSRSISTESMPSLASPDDFITSDVGSSPLSPSRSYSERRLLRLISTSEDCSSDHPLGAPDSHDHSQLSPPNSTPAPLRARRRTPPKKSNLSLKSSLSASLRALKSAAEAISNNIATSSPSPSMQPDDFAIFAIRPSLTDDRRPPPSSDLPSPALRRYLNPLPPSTSPESPLHLHFWHEDRHVKPTQSQSVVVQSVSSSKSKKKVAKNSQASRGLQVVPLQSCLPPQVRTAHASSPPIWLPPDGDPSNRNTAHNPKTSPSLPLLGPGQPRQREPRENRDFLRVLVAEMNMRRVGKMEDPFSTSDRPSTANSPEARADVDGGGADEASTGKGISLGPGGRYGKAVMWLPPVREDFWGKPDANGRKVRPAIDRWKAWDVGDIQPRL